MKTGSTQTVVLEPVVLPTIAGLQEQENLATIIIADLLHQRIGTEVTPTIILIHQADLGQIVNVVIRRKDRIDRLLTRHLVGQAADQDLLHLHRDQGADSDLKLKAVIF